MMEGGSERPAGAATTRPSDMHGAVNGAVENTGAAVTTPADLPTKAAKIAAKERDRADGRAEGRAPSPRTVAAVYCPLIDTSEDCLFRTSPPRRDRPGKCVRFNEHTENFYVPRIVVDAPDGEGDEVDDTEFEDSFDSLDLNVDVPGVEELEDDSDMGNSASIPQQLQPAALENGACSQEHNGQAGEAAAHSTSPVPNATLCLEEEIPWEEDVAVEEGGPLNLEDGLGPLENGQLSLENVRLVVESSLADKENGQLQVVAMTSENSLHANGNVILEDGLGDDSDDSLESEMSVSEEVVSVQCTTNIIGSGEETPKDDVGDKGERDQVTDEIRDTINQAGVVAVQKMPTPLMNGSMERRGIGATAEESCKTPIVPDRAGEKADHAKRQQTQVAPPDVQALQLQVTHLDSQLSERVQQAARLEGKVLELEHQVKTKEAAADRLQSELEASRRESEESKEKLKQVQSSLDSVRTSNEELNERLTEKLGKDVEDGRTLEALAARVAELEKQLDESRAERAALEEALAKAVAEAEAERDALEEALEEAMEDTTSRFQKEFEELRTVHADREQQLLADLEWKLREVQAAGKKKLEEKDRTLRELLAKVTNLEETASQAEKKVAAARAETEQLRGLNIEQQRALRLGTRDMEQLQVNEKVLKEEVGRLRAALDREKVHIDAILERHATELAETEREHQARVEQVKKDTAELWEARMHGEIIRLQTDLEQAHAEDKVAALHAQARELTQDADRQKKQLQTRLDLANAEVSTLTQKLSDRETQLNRELERLQTNSDRDVFELRRQLDKIDLKYQTQIESIEKQHEEEMEKLRLEQEKRLAACEQGFQLQSASTRANLELVKEQMRRDSEAALREQEERHRRSLEDQEQQRRRLEAQVSQLSPALDAAKEAEAKREQLAQHVATLQTELKQVSNTHKDALHKVQEEATRNVRAKERELAELRKQAEEERRRLRAELTKEADERAAGLQQRVDALIAQLKSKPDDRAAIDDLRRTLVAKDAAIERLRSSPRPEDAAQIQQLKDTVLELKAVIEKLRQDSVQADQLKTSLAEREKQLHEKDALVKDRDAALRKAQNNPRPQDAQKLDELRRLLKEKDMEIVRLNNEELSPLRQKAQEAAEKDAELQKVRAEAAQVRESLKQVSELKRALGEKEDAIARLTQQVNQKQREDSNKRLKQLSSQVEELKKALAEKDSALAKANAELAQVQRNLSEKAKTVESVQTAALRKALAEKEKLVARLEAEKDKEAARAEAARQTPRPEDAARIAELQRALSSKDEEVGRLREASKRPGDITEMQRALLSRDEEISRLRDAVRARHGPHEAELRRQLAEKEAALGRIQEENKRLQYDLAKEKCQSGGAGGAGGAQPMIVPVAIPVAAVQPQLHQKQQLQQQQQEQQSVQTKPQTPPQQPKQPQNLYKPQPTTQQQLQQPRLEQQQPEQQKQQQQQSHQPQRQQAQQQSQQPPQKTPTSEPEERKRKKGGKGKGRGTRKR